MRLYYRLTGETDAIVYFSWADKAAVLQKLYSPESNLRVLSDPKTSSRSGLFEVNILSRTGPIEESLKAVGATTILESED